MEIIDLQITKVKRVYNEDEANSLLENKWVLLQVGVETNDDKQILFYSLGYPYSAVEDDAIQREIEMNRQHRY